jgi:hypothetical protein
MNTTTDKEKKKRNIPILPIIILTQGLFFLLLWLCSPFFITRISVNKKELEEQVQKTESRSKKAWKQEIAKRKKRSIPKTHADELVKQEREKHKKLLHKRINSLVEIKKEMEKACDEKLKKIQSRQNNKERTAQKMKTTLDALLKNAEDIAKNETTKETKELLEKSKALFSKKNEILENVKQKKTDAKLDELITSTDSILDKIEKKEQEKSSILSKETGADNLFRKIQGDLRDLKDNVKRHKELASSLEKNQTDKKNNITRNIKNRLKGISRSIDKISKVKNQPEVKKLTDLIKQMENKIAESGNVEDLPIKELKKDIDEINEVSEKIIAKVKRSNDLGSAKSSESIKKRYTRMKQFAESYKKRLNHLATYKEKREKLFNTGFDKKLNEFSKILAQVPKKENQKSIDSINRLKEQLIKDKDNDQSQEREKTLKSLNNLRKATEELNNGNEKTRTAAKKLALQLDLMKNVIKENIQYRKIYNDEYKTHTEITRKQMASFTKENEQEFDNSLGNRKNVLAKAIIEKNNELKKLNSSNESIEANEKILQKLEELIDTSQKLNDLQKETGIYDKNLPNKLKENIKILRDNFDRDTANYDITQKNIAIPLKQITERIKKNINSVKETNKELQKNYSDVKKSDKIDEIVSTLPDSPQELIENKNIPDLLDNAEKRAGESVVLQEKAKAPNVSKIASFKNDFLTLKELLSDSKIIKQSSNATSILKKRKKKKAPLKLTDIKSMTAAAEDLDKSIIEDYATLRAAELALIQDKSFDSMYDAINRQLTEDHTKITPPEQTPKIKTIADLENYRKSLDKTVQKVNDVLRNAKTMQEQARGISQKNKNSSLVNSTSKSRDILNAIGKTSKKGNLQGSSPIGTGDSLHTGKESNKGGIGMALSTKQRAVKIDTKLVKAEALPGRRFTKKSNRKGWMYIDTWYIIGPWENQGRVDWNKKHQPEFDLNLSKTYKGGKNNQTLAWQFSQSQTIRCTPPAEKTNSTYYAYTELFFEEAQSMLIAIASDDAAKVWVNDRLVWQDIGLSEWTLDESFQEIAFKKGYNSVMIRIENGPGVCQFSMVLCPEKQ